MQRWTKKEIDVLKGIYETTTNEDLLKIFPNRSFLSIYKKAHKLGLKKNDNTSFIDRSVAMRGEHSGNWNGGKAKTRKGYIQILKRGHPRADSKGYVMEHIYVFEKETGVSVPPNCVIHHLDGDKTNNDISNLCMMSFGGHTTYHNKERVKKHE